MLGLLLAGCPLLGQQGNPDGDAKGRTSNPAFQVALEGDGTKQVAPLTYQIELDEQGEGRVLRLRATLGGTPASLDRAPTSSAPDIVRIDGPEQLTALAPGQARITVQHQDHEAELAVNVSRDEPTAAEFRVVNPELLGPDGPTDVLPTQSYKSGNRAMWASGIEVTILDSSGKAIPRSQCGQFAARPHPRTLPNNWPDPKDTGGIINMFETVGSDTDAEKPLPNRCRFGISGRGFPIIGSGAQEFMLNIHKACLDMSLYPMCSEPGARCGDGMPPNTICAGDPLPGGSIPFKIERQSTEQCSYCGS